MPTICQALGSPDGKTKKEIYKAFGLTGRKAVIKEIVTVMVLFFS